MTSIQEITEIVQQEVFNGTGTFNHDQANKQLEIARTTDNLGQQVLAVVKVVNRFPNVTNQQIKSKLMNFADTLRLIKAVNLGSRNKSAEEKLKQFPNVQVMYDKAVETFKNR
jgi:hypothetical protein